MSKAFLNNELLIGLTVKLCLLWRVFKAPTSLHLAQSPPGWPRAAPRGNGARVRGDESSCNLLIYFAPSGFSRDVAHLAFAPNWSSTPPSSGGYRLSSIRAASYAWPPFRRDLIRKSSSGLLLKDKSWRLRRLEKSSIVKINLSSKMYAQQGSNWPKSKAIYIDISSITLTCEVHREDTELSCREKPKTTSFDLWMSSGPFLNDKSDLFARCLNWK